MTLNATPLPVSIAVYLHTYMHECSVVNKKIAQGRAECVSSSPHKIPLDVIEQKIVGFCRWNIWT